MGVGRGKPGVGVCAWAGGRGARARSSCASAGRWGCGWMEPGRPASQERAAQRGALVRQRQARARAVLGAPAALRAGPRRALRSAAPIRRSRSAKKSGVSMGRQRATSNSISGASVSKKYSTRSSSFSGGFRACGRAAVAGHSKRTASERAWGRARPAREHALCQPAAAGHVHITQRRHGGQERAAFQHAPHPAAAAPPPAACVPAARAGRTC